MYRNERINIMDRCVQTVKELKSREPKVIASYKMAFYYPHIKDEPLDLNHCYVKRCSFVEYADGKYGDFLVHEDGKDSEWHTRLEARAIAQKLLSNGYKFI